MAENEDGAEKSEEATPKRREEFREKGQIAVSREVNSFLVLTSIVIFMSFYGPKLVEDCLKLMQEHIFKASKFQIHLDNIGGYFFETWMQFIVLIIPPFIVSGFVGFLGVMFQTRFNWSWKKLNPDFKRLNPLKGLANMVNSQALMNLAKGIAKMVSVGFVSYLILKSEWNVVPALMNLSYLKTIYYWGDITQLLLWATVGFLLLIAIADYSFDVYKMEQQLKMTKQEVKQEFKEQEVDPHVKAKIKRMQRQYAQQKMVQDTKDATVLIANPTHFSIVLKYELGMSAPVVVAKGQDEFALRLREVAKDNDVPIVENKPLARTLYRLVEVGQEIPDELYKAVSEVIRYVFELKGRKIIRS